MNNEIALELCELIKSNKGIFVDSTRRRSFTSINNADLHNEMLWAIAHDNSDSICKVLTNPRYLRPLTGVVYCMPDYDYEAKQKFIKFLDKNSLRVDY